MSDLPLPVYAGFDPWERGHDLNSSAAIAKYQVDCRTMPPRMRCAAITAGVANIATIKKTATTRPASPTARANPGPFTMTEDQLSIATD
jgi:hypothetical protein